MASSKIGVSGSVRKRILKKFNYTCQECGIIGFPVKRDRGGYGFYTEKEGVYLSIDHIYPRYLGGSSEEKNLTVLCTHCNSKKGIKVPEEQ